MIFWPDFSCLLPDLGLRIYKPLPVGSEKRRPSMEYHVSGSSVNADGMIPVELSFMKLKDMVPSAAIVMSVMGLPIYFRPSETLIRVAAGDELSVRLSFV